MRVLTTPLLLAIATAFVSCGRNTVGDDSAPFHTVLRRSAAEYQSYGRVDDMMRFAPELCMMPPPPAARVSSSDDGETHGQKLYYMFAKDRNAYLSSGAVQPIGQVLVKQAWHARVATDQNAVKENLFRVDTEQARIDEAGRFLPFARREGKVYELGAQADLFIMLKLDPATPGTDAGWVYATISPDRKTITAAGRIESCMRCHIDARPDRVFGIAPPAD